MITSKPAWSREEFEAQLRAKGQSYHIHHPFNVKMNAGECSKEQIRGWVLNRFYYQWIIPIKDAAVMSNCQDRETRRRWISRILDHDGFGEYQTDTECGGLEAWTRLGLAVGLDRETLWSLKEVEPAVKFACDAYVNQGLRARLARWHDDVDSAFYGWSQAWLDPAFRDWTLTPELESVGCPLLAIQGVDDEYGTMAQIAIIEHAVPGTTVVALEACGHSPHRDQTDAVIGAVSRWIATLLNTPAPSPQ